MIHACKEPCHRQALGYSGQAVAKAHPEYLIARRGDRLILNLIDADNPAYIPRAIMDAALAFLHETLQSGRRVLVHCNQGHSRAPSIGLLYLAVHTDRLPGDFPEAEEAFRAIYPAYRPAPGIRGFLRLQWMTYVGPKHDGAPESGGQGDGSQLAGGEIPTS